MLFNLSINLCPLPSPRCCYCCCYYYCCCYSCCCYSCCSDWIGKLRVFGNGENKISFCHVDNYCHGLILGAKALYPGSPALGQKSMTCLLFRETFCFKSYCIGYFFNFFSFLILRKFFRRKTFRLYFLSISLTLIY